MLKKLDRIRLRNQNFALKSKIINSLLIFLIGVFLGIFAKWLDNLALDDAIWWHRILEFLNLNNIFSEFAVWIFLAVTISVFSKTPLRSSLNVFLFFIGMNISYHLYTIFFSGFNPQSYMIRWYAITLVSPILAYICWYAKGDSKISILISSIILSIMFILCFNIGPWYFYLKSLVDLIIFAAILIVLYVKPKNILFSLLIGILLSFCVRLIV